MGGRISRLDRIATRLWQQLEHGEAFMTAIYIPTGDNPTDASTKGVTLRRRMLDTEVQLNPALVRELFRNSPFFPQIDWFASPTNAQLPRFYVWREMSKSRRLRVSMLSCMIAVNILVISSLRLLFIPECSGRSATTGPRYSSFIPTGRELCGSPPCPRSQLCSASSPRQPTFFATPTIRICDIR